jgi:hypothetical protein
MMGNGARRRRIKLVDAVERWERAERIQAFCLWVESNIDSVPAADRNAAAEWLRWAKLQAEALKPLRGNTDLFSQKVYVEEWYEEDRYRKPNTGWWSSEE